jgi:hypothetical protein
MSRRLKITLPESIVGQLEDLAASTREPVARVGAQLIRQALSGPSGSATPPTKRTALLDPPGTGLDERAPWLEPYGGDRQWRVEMWGSVVALHGRYPYALEALQEGWWESYALTEMLCALALWRQWIDDSGRDPREELQFHIHLAEFTHVLRQEGGGGVTNQWTPGAPPRGWA